MSSLFGGSTPAVPPPPAPPPPPPAPPPVPTANDAALAIQQQQNTVLAQRLNAGIAAQGLADTDLTGGTGVTSPVAGVMKTLLGSN